MVVAILELELLNFFSRLDFSPYIYRHIKMLVLLVIDLFNFSCSKSFYIYNRHSCCQTFPVTVGVNTTKSRDFSNKQCEVEPKKILLWSGSEAKTIERAVPLICGLHCIIFTQTCIQLARPWTQELERRKRQQ